MDFLGDNEQEHLSVDIDPHDIDRGIMEPLCDLTEYDANAIFIKEEIDTSGIESENEATLEPWEVKVKSEENENFEVAKEDFLVSEDAISVKIEPADKPEENICIIKGENETFEVIDSLDIGSEKEAVAGCSGVKVELEEPNIVCEADDFQKKKLVNVQNREGSRNALTARTVECDDRPLKSEDDTTSRNLAENKRAHSVEYSFYCDVCQKGFNQKRALTKHLRIHSGQRPYHCDICQKGFTGKANLTRHLRIHSGDRPFHCDVCKKGFIQKVSLIRHLRVHSGEKPFLCDVCQKAFSQKGSLVEHLRIHSGERPFHCDVCQKAFIQKGSLIDHLRIHSGKMPFRCDVCHKGFTQKGKLVKHLQLHSAGGPFL